MIIIVTGPIHSGKTTKLQQIIQQWKKVDISAILEPLDKNGNRTLFVYPQENTIMLQTDEQDGAIECGPFYFLAGAFETAASMVKTQCSIFILDEIGKLEIQNKGFHSLMIRILENYKNGLIDIVIVVIRDTLLHSALQHYQMKDTILINKDQLEIFFWNAINPIYTITTKQEKK
jgi:nucleoside-triphosphatase THEP1